MNSKKVNQVAMPDDNISQAAAIPQKPCENHENKEDLINVKFNKQPQSFSRQEAVPYVEMGLKWESFKSQHQSLKALADEKGLTVSQYIDSLKNPESQSDLQTAKKQNIENKGMDLEYRLAKDFITLREMVPGTYKSFDELEQQVVDISLAQNISLFDAWLRYQHETAMQNQKDLQNIQANLKSQSKSNSNAIGSLTSQNQNNLHDSATVAFSNAFLNTF